MGEDKLVGFLDKLHLCFVLWYQRLNIRGEREREDAIKEREAC